MPDPHDSASFAALHDDASRDAAIARALGWRPAMLPEPDRCEHEPSHGYPIPCWVLGDVGPEPERDDTNVWWCDTPPPYFTGGDLDAFANWDLLAPVVGLLPLPNDLAHTSRDTRFASAPWEVTAMLHLACDKTPHRAACHVAVAAGLVPKGGE